MRVMRSLRSMIRLAIFNGYIPMRNNPLWVVSSFLSPFSFLWITVSFMVFLISTYIKSERLVWPLASILGLGLSIFPPVYYPVTILPEPVRWIAIIPPHCICLPTTPSIFRRPTRGPYICICLDSKSLYTDGHIHDRIHD